MYTGVEEINGKKTDVSKHLGQSCNRRPFKALLDVGLARTTTGSRIFGALKGATDGGLYIPHSTRRFPGSSKGNKKKKISYDADVHRSRIFGRHIQDYSYGLEAKDEENGTKEYITKFRQWSDCVDKFIEQENISGDGEGDYEELYTFIHKAIRADPTFTKKEKKGQSHPVLRESKARGGQGQMCRYFAGKGGKEYRRDRRLTNAERKQNVANKIAAHEAVM